MALGGEDLQKIYCWDRKWVCAKLLWIWLFGCLDTSRLHWDMGV